MSYRRTLLSIVTFAALASSCRRFPPADPSLQPEPMPAVSTDTAVAASAQAAPLPLEQASVLVREARSLDDAKIAAIMLAANNTDISYARLVPSRASRQDVKEFAQRMLTDHVGVNALLTEMLAKIDLTPEDSPMSVGLRDESVERRDLMRELNGYAFDSTYIENEVSYHRKFLYAIDNSLEPRARNEELKTLLMSVRPAVAAHLAHAEQVRANVLTRK